MPDRRKPTPWLVVDRSSSGPPRVYPLGMPIHDYVDISTATDEFAVLLHKRTGETVRCEVYARSAEIPAQSFEDHKI